MLISACAIQTKPTSLVNPPSDSNARIPQVTAPQEPLVEPPIEEPINPNADRVLSLKGCNMTASIQRAMTLHWELLTTNQEQMGYEDLVNSGVLAIIFANRYTGADIANVANYSPGDIYLFQPSKSVPEFHFWWYLGEKDYAYDADLASKGERHALKRSPDYSIDGRTIFNDAEFDPSELFPSISDGARERYGIPTEDDARAKMFVLADSINELLVGGDELGIKSPPTLESCISNFGRPNPVSWTNPYTGAPMQEVPWVKVPLYQAAGDPYSDPLPELASEEGNDSQLQGNYSYGLGDFSGEEHPHKAFAQFYFKMPDGSTAAYIAWGPVQ